MITTQLALSKQTAVKGQFRCTAPKLRIPAARL